MNTQFNQPTVSVASAGTSARRLLHVWLASFAILIADCAWAQSNASALPPNQAADKTQKASEQSLVDGLLDLLDESDATKQPTQPGVKQDRSQPAGVGGPASANPLWEVRDRMRVAAGFLQQGRSDQETVELQSSIVSDLDALIEQLEQMQKSSQQSSSRSMTPSQQQQSQQQGRSQQSQRSQQSKSQQTGDSSNSDRQAASDPNDNTSQDASRAGVEPGNDPSGSRSNDASLRRNDPTALQQSVWGHLPDRVRSQMQSRMVEEFLPSYRQQIEAYYRALLEERGEK